MKVIICSTLAVLCLVAVFSSACNHSSYGAAASCLTGRSRWHRGTRDARQGFKVERHVVRGVETLFGILFQAVTDDALQSRRHVKIGFGQLGRFAVQY